jgi:UV excision repair protein RAD23
MHLLLKNLKQQEYQIEIESAQKTVKDLKLEIEKVHNFDSSCIKLLHSGVVLEDDKKLEEYKIKEGNVIIMMLLKPKKVEAKPEPNQKEELQQQEPPKNEENKPQPQYTEQINALVDMGYEKEKVERAIKAANGSIDLAVEYLNEEQIPNQNEPNTGNANSNIPSSSNSNLPEELKKNASIIKCLCMNNPEKLPSILTNLKEHSPQLFELIKQHEEDFKNLLVSPLSEEDIRNFQSIQQELRRPPGQTIRLTKEESDAVKRLQELGFSQADAVQAYFACDKNEEMAANFLFEQKMRDEAEGNNQNQNNQNQGQGQGQGQG